MSAVPPPPPPVIQPQPAALTKNCPKCAMVVPKAASVCPYCRKRLGTHPLTMGCAVLFGLVVVMAFIGNLVSQTRKPSNAIPPTAEEKKSEVSGEAPKVWRTPSAEDQKIIEQNQKRDKQRLDKEWAERLKEIEKEKTLQGPAAKLRAKHPDWSDEVCLTIVKHEITYGMTQEMVRAAWGAPDHTYESKSVAGQDYASWSYGGDSVIFQAGVYTSLTRFRH